MMQPAIVMPMHDPTALMFPHLKAITPQLKELFSRAFVSITPVTAESQPDQIAWLKAERFFHTLHYKTEVPVGEDFLRLYIDAAAACPSDQILHLCFIDRVAFALQSEYRTGFMADLQALPPEQTPLIFLRSESAWQTHPRNYRRVEAMATTVGELLFKKRLDFAWCHLAVRAGQLRAILPHINRRDLSMVAEIVLQLRDELQTRAVDWLAWEDPFIYSRDPQQLKEEREQSPQETRKRLSYVLPMLQLLQAAADEDL